MLGSVTHAAYVFGSSPRPWGNGRAFGWALAGRRFIPTPVGKWAGGTTVIVVWAVHPHARGEMVRASDRRVSLPGSSPRPWGNGLRDTLSMPNNRFIPTPVGKWNPTFPRRPADPVHPHARGEMFRHLPVFAERAGSSPRPWGNGNPMLDRRDICRFIPTPVGKCWVQLLTRLTCSVHPHARGEMAGRSGGHLPGGGSSPRPWGNGPGVR